MEFGTDGFRGRAEEFSDIGLKRIGYELSKMGLPGQIVIGSDIRKSSERFRKNLIKGINSGGSEAIDLGIVTTPAVSYFSKVIPSAKYGIMITASHNPYYDNGIKVFQYGNKISSDLEKRLQVTYNNSNLNFTIAEPLKVIFRDPINYLKYVQTGLNQLNILDRKIVFDLANGGAYNFAKMIFNRGNYIFLNDTPNGININENCGIIHPKNIESKVLENEGYLGVTYDGDCDRVGFCDENGKYVDGDFILGFLACDMLKKGQLKNNTLVVTEYSNIALDNYIESLGGKVIRVQNGDKFVYAKMKEGGYSFGGEKLGHIIFGTELGSGDGLFTTKEVLSRLDYSKSFSEQIRGFELNPQIILNVPIIDKIPFEKIDGFEEIMGYAKKYLNGSGRVLVRYSGTEDLCRIMVEGKENLMINQIASEIASKFT